jgi:hypothetical protein
MISPRRHLMVVSAFAGLACLVTALNGCGSQVTAPGLDSPSAKRLERIGDAYLRATVHLNKPPASDKELLPFLKEQGKPEELSMSPVDKEKYVIVWGVELRMLKATGTAVPVVAYEKKGADGKRHVLRGRSDVYLLTEGELRNSVLPAGHSFPF